jgi:DNA-binding NtrC family response regulator
LTEYSIKSAPFEETAAHEQTALSSATPKAAGVSVFTRASLPSFFEAEREVVRMTLNACKGNKTHTAQRLGLSREGLRKKLRRLGMNEKQ